MILGFVTVLLIEFSWPFLVVGAFILQLPVRSACRMLTGKTGAIGFSQAETDQLA